MLGDCRILLIELLLFVVCGVYVGMRVLFAMRCALAVYIELFSCLLVGVYDCCLFVVVRCALLVA